ncbi:16S rRNA (cytosine(967)-C(5))-methyltransferase RsmB [Montanilutibacter psychrotolerans]|uniref:16S rRNA (cytosine(967)-C(5))-methyltransferase n=1 Tax=Montanilutibacter psychrotolerans TaxID=1327343 RepID=A0A3M8SYI1_9GAMM|nr:16S rRNA (cytosine(967)-C(5))-methyltransferase RsmB [Lysobacter psychrotolerans]RNF84496.1 16S rRNA (cytosine(967)-C(5))-methyltransferase RsmB [Lysobacter psychrotolerans]
MSAGAAPRAIAADVLDAVLHRGRSLKAELASALPPLRDPRDRALVEAICFAVLRQPQRYAAAVDAWMARPLPKRDARVRTLLFAGFAQLDPLGLAAHAAVAATVEAARMLGFEHHAGLVNALLRRAQREGLPAVDPHAHWPQWLREQLQRDWGDDAAGILDASAIPAPMWLRVNARRVDRDGYAAQLRDAGIAATTVPALADALRLEESVAVAALPGFDEGAVSVQDASAQLVVDALAPVRGARVLDACAAPGGKAAHLLERDPELSLVALEIDAARLRRMRTGLARLGLGGRGRLLAADAAALPSWWDDVPFDAVLLDAPCSATGVVRRQPDVLLHRREADMAALVATQARLLDALWRTVAPGGVLLYATCSILKAENDAQVAAFLARTADAALEPLDGRFGRAVSVDGVPAGYQRLPGEGGGDGFFYARLRKSAKA